LPAWFGGTIGGISNMSDSTNETELDRQIARQSLWIEQVRLHLQELSPETFEFRRGAAWLERLLFDLALLRYQERRLAFFAPGGRSAMH
jgi:hypothetical protein